MRVVILIGLPGSGKSTMASKYFPGYFRISQDELGSREACISAMHQALIAKKDVIVDRTNINKKQRQHWINLALEYGAETVLGVYLDVPAEECVARIIERPDHPTIPKDMPLEKKMSIIYQFSRDMELPTLDEGFSSVLYTRN